MKEELLRLAERCEAASEPSLDLDHDIGRALGTDGNYSYRPYTHSVDAAMTLAEGYMVVALSDIAADGLAGCCLCSDTSTNPPTEHWGIPCETGPRHEVWARALCAASLKARASVKEQNNGE